MVGRMCTGYLPLIFVLWNRELHALRRKHGVRERRRGCANRVRAGLGERGRAREVRGVPGGEVPLRR
jgi:hypothetical protein